jgi:hypothetical protein
MKIEIELEDLKKLLKEQIKLTAERLLDGTYQYNTESTESHLKTLPIDKNKFITKAMGTKFPDDILVLNKYLPKR